MHNQQNAAFGQTINKPFDISLSLSAHSKKMMTFRLKTYHHLQQATKM